MKNPLNVASGTIAIGIVMTVLTPVTGTAFAGTAAAVSEAFLQVPSDGNSAEATAINEDNVVAGFYHRVSEDRDHGLLWRNGKVATVLSTLPGGEADKANDVPHDINDHGIVIGSSNGHAVKWDLSGAVTAVDTGNYTSNAWAINNTGTAIGSVYGDDKEEHPVRWSSSGIRSELPTPNGENAQAFALNDSGVIVGGTNPYAAGGHAVMWGTSGTLTELADPPGTIESRATGINSSGVIVGTAKLAAGGLWRPVRWDGRTVTQLPVPSNGGIQPYSDFKINDNGLVVGELWTFDNVNQVILTYAVQWDRNGVLSELGTSDGYARAVNNKGVVVGGDRQWTPEG